MTITGHDVRVHPLAPVVAFDIDNTFADYSGHFLAFAQQYLQEPGLDYDWKDEYEGEFSLALDLPKDVYRDIKLAYRQGGMKRSIPVIDENVRTLVAMTRAAGLQAWICTTRPWMRLDNIDPDTQFWLGRNVGRVDGLIYGEDKYLDLIDIVGKDRIVGVFDDLPENYEAATDAGLRVSLRAGHHNRWYRMRTHAQTRSSGRPVPEISYTSLEMWRQIQEWKDQ